MPGRKKANKNTLKLLNKIKPKTLLVMIAVTIFSLVGVYMLTMSNAAPNTINGPVYALYSNYRSVLGTNITTVSDNVGDIGTHSVTQVGTGGELTYGGKGGGNPVSTKTCYFLRPVDGSATIKVWGINNTRQITVDPGDQAYYQEICVERARKDQPFPGYSLKVLSGKVNVFQTVHHFYFENL